MSEQVASEFVNWFQLQHGNLDTAKVGIVEFPGHGRGAIALQDIPVRTKTSPSLCFRCTELMSIYITGRLYLVHHSSRANPVNKNVRAAQSFGRSVEGARPT